MLITFDTNTLSTLLFVLKLKQVGGKISSIPRFPFLRMSRRRSSHFFFPLVPFTRAKSPPTSHVNSVCVGVQALFSQSYGFPESSRCTTQVSIPALHVEKLGWSLQFLASAWPHPTHCRHFRNQAADGSLCPSSRINQSTNTELNKLICQNKRMPSSMLKHRVHTLSLSMCV